MKNVIWIVAAVAVLAICGKEEPAPAPADEPTAIEESQGDTAPEAAAANEDETLEVVEESAAEPEPEEEAILLAQAEMPAAPANWQFKEGRNFTRLVPTQPTVGGADKIEVGYFFWYGCPHCYNFDPTMTAWAANKPANVRFVRIPGTWNNILVLHAKLYYTEEVLVRNGVIKDGEAFHVAVFQEYHERRNRLTSEAAIRQLFERYGVSGEEFDRTWNSFEVAQKLRVAQDLMRRYGIASVPMVVVNGKYKTDGAAAGGYDKVTAVIDELVQRESMR